jgi:hypothetical protein
VLYPTIRLPPPPIAGTEGADLSFSLLLPEYAAGYDHIFMSINRFERKKTISLAIDALHQLLRMLRRQKAKTSEASSADPGQIPAAEDEEDDEEFVMVNHQHHMSADDLLLEESDPVYRSASTPLSSEAEVQSNSVAEPAAMRILLVIAGGYDPQMEENHLYLQELQQHADRLQIPWRIECGASEPAVISQAVDHNPISAVQAMVIFRPSIPLQEKQALLAHARGLICLCLLLFII